MTEMHICESRVNPVHLGSNPIGGSVILQTKTDPEHHGFTDNTQHWDIRGV